jgi:acyl dehydratase
MNDPVTFPVDPVHIMLFARAVCDDNPMYRDAEMAARTALGGIVAPPTFSEALQQFIPEYQMRPRPGVPWAGSQHPEAAGRPPESVVLHAEQRFIYHRPIYAGEILTARKRPGNTWQKTSKRHGSMVFREVITEFFDSSEALVLTAIAVGVEVGTQP